MGHIVVGRLITAFWQQHSLGRLAGKQNIVSYMYIYPHIRNAFKRDRNHYPYHSSEIRQNNSAQNTRQHPTRDLPVSCKSRAKPSTLAHQPTYAGHAESKIWEPQRYGRSVSAAHRGFDPCCEKRSIEPVCTSYSSAGQAQSANRSKILVRSDLVLASNGGSGCVAVAARLGARVRV
jgi:hypothetical protein